MSRDRDQIGPERSYDVWCEGYQSSGDSSKAYKVGTTLATSFAQACDILLCDDKNYNPETLESWFCGLYDNERDARKNFG